jgi:hypothetical protein
VLAVNAEVRAGVDAGSFRVVSQRVIGGRFAQLGVGAGRLVEPADGAEDATFDHALDQASRSELHSAGWRNVWLVRVVFAAARNFERKQIIFIDE